MTHNVARGAARRAAIWSTWILALAVTATACLARWPSLPRPPALSAPHWVIARASNLGASAELLRSADPDATREPETVAAAELGAVSGGRDGREIAAGAHGAYPWDRRDRSEATSAGSFRGGGDPSGSGYLWDSGSLASDGRVEPSAIER